MGIVILIWAQQINGCLAISNKCLQLNFSNRFIHIARLLTEDCGPIFTFGLWTFGCRVSLVWWAHLTSQIVFVVIHMTRIMSGLQNVAMREISPNNIVSWTDVWRTWLLSTLRTMTSWYDPLRLVDSIHNRPIMRSFGVYLFLVWISCWEYSGYAGDLRRHDAHMTPLWWSAPGVSMGLPMVGFSLTCT